MFTAEELAALRALIREELSSYAVKRKPPEDISEKRRAAARAMLAKRAARANAEQIAGMPKRVNGAHHRANAEQKMVIGDGEHVIHMPSLRGDVEVRMSFVRELIEAYPAVMVGQEFERAKLWLEANPSKRKTNVRRFLTTWISRAQERGGSR